MLAGFERFAIEFLRPNPRIIFGLSEAQLISLVLIALGLFGWRWFITSVQTLKVR
jgi:prolipoprotein diacylglyceryltransferase